MLWMRSDRRRQQDRINMRPRQALRTKPASESIHSTIGNGKVACAKGQRLKSFDQLGGEDSDSRDTPHVVSSRNSGSHFKDGLTLLKMESIIQSLLWFDRSGSTWRVTNSHLLEPMARLEAAGLHELARMVCGKQLMDHNILPSHAHQPAVRTE
jgi:hypothetical protein